MTMIIRLLLLLSMLGDEACGFAPSILQHSTARSTKSSPFVMRYRSTIDSSSHSDDTSITKTSYLQDSRPLSVQPALYEGETMEILNNNNNDNSNKPSVKSMNDPSMVEFASSVEYQVDADNLLSPEILDSGSHYPFAMMMRCSAEFISAHLGQIAVFHLPGEILGDEKSSDSLFSDMALAWLLGMKLVVVVGSLYDIDSCDMDFEANPHACHNSLKVTDAETLRHLEEEAGYLRTEIERKLNRFLRVHGGTISNEHSPAPEGNVVSGNFYSAKRFGHIRGEDFEYTGFTSGVHVENIKRVLNRNDVVLLTTVGVSSLGELVNVNGYHLTATVASALKAYKLVYLANEGTILHKKGEQQASLQDIPLSFAKAITDYHDVHVHNTGFATFEQAQESLHPGSVELLLHLGWACWALENGVTRAHIVNPGDGALLEELFTSKNGANTCLFRDEENQETPDGLFEDDMEEFFASASKQNKRGTSSLRYW